MELDLRDVAYNVVHDFPGGVAAVAPRVGSNATTLAHELNGTGQAKLGMKTAEKITRATQDMRILEAFAGNFGRMTVPLPGMPIGVQDECMKRLAEMAKEFSKMCSDVAEELSDGKVDDNEMSEFDHECGLMIGAIHRMRDAMEAKNREYKAEMLSHGMGGER